MEQVVESSIMVSTKLLQSFLLENSWQFRLYLEYNWLISLGAIIKFYPGRLFAHFQNCTRNRGSLFCKQFCSYTNYSESPRYDLRKQAVNQSKIFIRYQLSSSSSYLRAAQCRTSLCSQFHLILSQKQPKNTIYKSESRNLLLVSFKFLLKLHRLTRYSLDSAASAIFFMNISLQYPYEVVRNEWSIVEQRQAALFSGSEMGLFSDTIRNIGSVIFNSLINFEFPIISHPSLVLHLLHCDYEYELIRNLAVDSIEQKAKRNYQGAISHNFNLVKYTIRSLLDACGMKQEIEKKRIREKEHYQGQIKDLKRRIEQQKYEREQIESRYFNILRKLEDEIQERKKKYQKLESKIEPLLDNDTVRLKILNEVEGVHFMELNEEKRKVSLLKDEVLKLKRETQILKHQVESQKIDHEQKIRKVKMWAEQNKSQYHFDEMTYGVCAELENKLRLNYEQARKESEYYKDKYFSSEKKSYQKIANLERQLQILKDKQAILRK